MILPIPKDTLVIISIYPLITVIYVCVCVCVCVKRPTDRKKKGEIKELYGVGHMVKDNSDSWRGNPLPPLHGLLFSISSKGYFICIIPQTG